MTKTVILELQRPFEADKFRTKRQSEDGVTALPNLFKAFQ
jgi:hypothetical protein